MVISIIGLMLIPSWLWFHFNGVTLCPAAMDCAQLARNLVQGKGFNTDFIRPASLFFFGRISDHPDLFNPPLHSFLLSMAFRVIAASDKVIYLYSLAIYWVMGLLVMILARKIFNNITAFIVGFIYFTNVELLNSVIEGSPLLLNSLLLVILFYFLYCRKDTYLSWFLIGIFMGISYLASYLWLWFFLPLIIYILIDCPQAPENKSKVKLLIFPAVGFILVAIGWWWRNWQITGNPFFNLGGDYKMFTSLFPGSSFLRETDLLSFKLIPSLKQLIFKWGRGSELIYQNLLFITGSFMAPFFWIALFFPFHDRRWSRLRFFLFACLLMGIFRFIICGRLIEDINIIIPIAILAGTAAFLIISDKFLPSRTKLKRYILVIFIGLNLFPFLDRLRITTIYPPPTKNNLLRARKLVERGKAIISDQPWAVAWYAGRESVWLSAKPENLPMLLERFPEIEYIYLTAETNLYQSSESSISWAKIYSDHSCFGLWRMEDISYFPREQFLARISREKVEKQE